MISAPCKDCPDRRPHCHGECDRYKQFCRENKEQKDAIKAIRAEEIQLLNLDPKFEMSTKTKRNWKGR